MELCVFCNTSLGDGEDIVQLREKGCMSVNKTSVARNDSIVTSPGQRVHKICRRDYTNPRTRKKEIVSETKDVKSSHELRSATETFHFDKNCLFCGKPAKFSDRKRGIDVFPIRTVDFTKNLTDICRERNDE
jgi:hypothetical protein